MGDPGSYRALEKPCSAELREKGSRFLALLGPVANSDEARSFRSGLAAVHRGATHFCWAERVGQPAIERFSDAGEPRGTAGEPIARTLRGHQLSDVVAVVVRWFGGVKLGKGGLSRAYAGAVAAALENASFEERFPTIHLRVRMAYDKVGAVKHTALSHRAEWLSEEYGAGVEVTLRVRKGAEAALLSTLADLRVEAVLVTEDGS